MGARDVLPRIGTAATGRSGAPPGSRSPWLAVVGVVGVIAALAVPAMAAGPVPGADVTYTTTADFAKGTAVNLNADTPDQLQLNKTTSTFPFIWVALSQRSTIAKIDTRTGQILGEYRGVAQDQSQSNETSRTTVMLDGSVWFGFRYTSEVTHVGLLEANECVDRNHNGVIDTSQGYGNVLDWPTGGAENAADECILQHVDTPGSDSRNMAVDKDGNIWVGDYAGGHGFVKLNGSTGEFLLGDSTTPYKSFPCGGYGGLIDKNGVLWSSNGGSNGLLRWDLAGDPTGASAQCIDIPVYGLAIDPSGNIWVNELGSNVRKVAADGTVLGTFPNGQSSSQGLAADANGDIWTSASLFCSSSCGIGHLLNDGTLVGVVPTPTGSGSTGVAVDGAGKIWAANRNSSTAVRIDPLAGDDSTTAPGHKIGAVDLTVDLPATTDDPTANPPTIALGPANPYNYSDMTGNVALTSTSPQGTWSVVQDAGAGNDNFNWHTISFNNEKEGYVPPGASITLNVEARAANTEAGLGSESYQSIQSCIVNTNLHGRFLQVRVTLKANAEGQSPVLSDVVIRGGPGVTPGECVKKAPEPTPTGTPTTPTGPTVHPKKLLHVAGDYNGDGTADLAVFRPSNGTWYVRDQLERPYGRSTDIPVPGDYNGDGKRDVAVWRPSNATWYVDKQLAVSYGRLGDIPVPADYNGDGKTDLAVYRPSNGTWYVDKQMAVPYGRSTDVPVAADFTGDGKADLAVFRPGNGTWYGRNLFATAFGQAGDKPVVADYNGDGKAELAYYRPSNGSWNVVGLSAVLFGRSTDIAVPADYNGDGKADLGVFRPGNGTWYVDKVLQVPFGRAADVPVTR